MTSSPVPERLARLGLLALLLSWSPLAAARLDCRDLLQPPERTAPQEALQETWPRERAALLLQGDAASAAAALEQRQRERLASLLADYRRDAGGRQAIAALPLLLQHLDLLFGSPFEDYPDTGRELPLPPWVVAGLATHLRQLSLPAGPRLPPVDTYAAAENYPCVQLRDPDQGIDLMALPGIDPALAPAPVQQAPGKVVYRLPSAGLAAAHGAYLLARQGGLPVRLALQQPLPALPAAPPEGVYDDGGRVFPLELETSLPVYAVGGARLAAGTLRRVHTGDACTGWVEVEFAAPLPAPWLGLLVVAPGSQPTQAAVQLRRGMYGPVFRPWDHQPDPAYRQFSAQADVDLDDDGLPDLRFSARKIESRARDPQWNPVGTWRANPGYGARVQVLRDTPAAGPAPASRPGQDDAGIRLPVNVFRDCDDQ